MPDSLRYGSSWLWVLIPSRMHAPSAIFRARSQAHMNRSLQAKEFQKRTRNLQRREAQVWLGALFFMVAVLIGLAAVTARAKSDQLPYILLGFIVLSIPVSIGLRNSRQAVKTARQQLLRQIAPHSGSDDLGLVDESTGLLNRRYFDRYARKEFAVADRTGFSMGMLTIRVWDSNKPGQDRAPSEKFFVQFADMLRANFRDSDTLIRLNDAEFLVLMLACNERRSSEAAQRLTAKADEWNRENPKAGYKIALCYATAQYVRGQEIPPQLDELSRRLRESS
jgi:GGDEF domain-containing protein